MGDKKVKPVRGAFNFDFRVENITMEHAAAMMEEITHLIDEWNGKIGGGFVEVPDESES